jgi:hypothetical protein
MLKPDIYCTICGSDFKNYSKHILEFQDKTKIGMCDNHYNELCKLLGTKSVFGEHNTGEDVKISCDMENTKENFNEDKTSPLCSGSSSPMLHRPDVHEASSPVHTFKCKRCNFIRDTSFPVDKCPACGDGHAIVFKSSPVQNPKGDDQMERYFYALEEKKKQKELMKKAGIVKDVQKKCTCPRPEDKEDEPICGCCGGAL